MLNRVELIVLGINLVDLNSINIVVDSKGQLPTKEITEDSLEKCRNELFKIVAGLDPDWVNLKLLDALKVGEDGILIVYTCTIPTDITLINDYKFLPLSEVKGSTFGEHNYTLIYKAMEKR